MGVVDRIIRIILAVAVAVLFIIGQLTGLAALILGIIALIFLLTSTVEFCPLYLPFKISTRKDKKSE
ncbi:MAG: DUF2892 domain-containing protein [Candidatus Aminicenantales bacterium]